MCKIKNIAENTKRNNLRFMKTAASNNLKLAKGTKFVAKTFKIR
jgi:hypothetical protein